MFSLQIHVEIVLRILEFGQSDSSALSKKEKSSLVPLKTNCLQLLNEKISSYNQGFLAKATKPLQSVFKRLISYSVERLSEGMTAYRGSAITHQVEAEATAFNESLMAVLQFTCCAKTLPRVLQASSLDIVQQYQALFCEEKYALKHL